MLIVSGQGIFAAAYRVAVVADGGIAINSKCRITFIVGTARAFADILSVIPPGYTCCGVRVDIVLRTRAVAIGDTIELTTEVGGRAGAKANLFG